MARKLNLKNNDKEMRKFIDIKNFNIRLRKKKLSNYIARKLINIHDIKKTIIL